MIWFYIFPYKPPATVAMTVCTPTYTDGQTDRRTDGQTDRRTGGQAGRQAGAQADESTHSSVTDKSRTTLVWHDCILFYLFQDYEVRKYEPSMWVATEMTTFEFSDNERRDLFYKLFHYISGNNSASKF